MTAKRSQLAKLTRPRLHKAVARERLFALLDEAREHKPAICVVGPPGAGKTTVVASWLDTRGIKGIWYQVDPGDADLATFFYYLGEAAKPFTRKGRRPLPLLTPEYLQDVEAFSRRFFRDLFSRLPQGAVLALDNYQEVVPEQNFHKLVAQAVEDVPAGMTLIALSRRDPPDCYARLIANENVQLIDWDDLQLTFEETRLIVKAKGRLESPGEIERLHQQSGGWAAGLTLILEGYRRSSSQLHDVPAGRDAIFEYFAAQIFARVSGDVRQFLMATSFLPTVQISVAEALTGEPSSGAILEDLYRRHLFTHRRPGQEPSYWYHALFREFLQEKARAHLDAVEVRGIMAAAARLLEAQGHSDGAVALYLKVGDWEPLRALVLRLAPQLLAQGRAHSLREWILALPAEQTAQWPWLDYWLGQALMAQDQKQARAQFEASFSAFSRSEDKVGRVLAACAVIDTVYFEWSDFRILLHWIATIEGLLEGQIDFDSPETEIKVYSSLLIAMLYGKPRHVRFFACVDRVRELLEREMDPNRKVLAATFLLTYCALGLDANRGREVVARIGGLIGRAEVTPLNRLWWHLRLGWFLYRVVGDSDGAMAALDTARSIADQHGLEGLRSSALLMLSYRLGVLLGRGEYRQANDLVEEMRTRVDPARPMDKWHSAEMQGHLDLALGKVDGVIARSAEQLRDAQVTGMQYVEAQSLIQKANALAQLGELDRLAQVAGKVRAMIEGTWFAWYENELPFFEGCALLRCGRRKEAQEVLARGFAHARQIGYPFPEWSYLHDFPWLCAEALAAGIETDFVQQLVRRLRLRSPMPDAEFWPWPVKVIALGTFEVYRDGERLEFSGKVPKKPLMLLKALIAFGGRNVPEERLMDALWPDEEADAARKSLDITVLRLRRLLGIQEAVLVSDELISLNTQMCWTDVWAFEHRTAQAEAADGEAGLSAAVAALALYRGNFLPAEVEEPWTVKARERLRAKFVRLVESVAQTDEAAGHWEKAMAHYLKGIEADDLVEAFHLGLMRCYRALGRPAEAMTAYRRLRQTLSVVLGIAPSPAAEALAQQLREGSAARYP